MSHKRPIRPGGDTPPTKKTKDKSPAKSDENKLYSLPGGKCPHCDEDCTTESNAIQCDLCHCWVHSECEGITSELYEQMNLVFSRVNNVLYYCEYNSCNSRIKQLVSDWKLSYPPVEEIDKSVQSLSSKYKSLTESVSDLSSKIESLLSRNSNLQMEIDSVTEQSTGTQAAPTTSAASTMCILDELADRERRSRNLIIYNLSESTDSKADTPKIKDLLNTVFSLDVNLSRVSRLGRKNESKTRPLLISFEDVVARSTLLSHSRKLRNFDQYKNVYLAPDRTKMEREKHQKLVNELKHRRSNGEQNLTIRNGTIVSVTRRSQPSAQLSASNDASASTQSS